MQAVLAGAKEVTRQPARMVKAYLAVIKAGVEEEGREDEFSSVFVVGDAIKSADYLARNDSFVGDDAVLASGEFTAPGEISAEREGGVKRRGQAV